ncbi:hypothetical protein KEG38_21305 [Polyangium jinanense]|uniref:hypothetical protein n=1 Tax=Polyangium jinanense TaxID=2829994 RepID=UPI0023412409|nr:hypothetical protein [Polyangium jinanense]MDC3952266.1 hypothetical protein [Polyangium jinanense]MDC3956411.1 hypothetical protein [Polyangium jinanense]
MRHCVSTALSLIACLSLVACEKSGSEGGAPPAPSIAPATTVPSGKTAEVAPSAAPSPSASAALPAEPPGLVGTWEGKYDAKKGEVEMPPKVKDKVRTKDDGKVAVGSGTLTLTIGPDGELKGKTSGALGAAALSGKVEGDEVRATFFPEDALSKEAMFGIVQGKRKDDKIVGRIRVASGDASIVREAEIELKKKD